MTWRRAPVVFAKHLTSKWPGLRTIRSDTSAVSSGLKVPCSYSATSSARASRPAVTKTATGPAFMPIGGDLKAAKTSSRLTRRRLARSSCAAKASQAGRSCGSEGARKPMLPRESGACRPVRARNARYMATSGPNPDNPRSRSDPCSIMAVSSSRRALAPCEVRAERLSISLRIGGVDVYARSAAAESAALPRPAGSSQPPPSSSSTHRHAAAPRAVLRALSRVACASANRSPSSRRATQSSATEGSSSAVVTLATSRAAASRGPTSSGIAATTGLAPVVGPPIGVVVGRARSCPTTMRTSPSYGEDAVGGSTGSMPST